MAVTTGAGAVEKNEIVFPPRKLQSTGASHIGTAVVRNLEECLLGCSLDVALLEMSAKYHSINFISCGDSASGNLKMISEFYSYIQEEARKCNTTLTSVFTPCMLRQYSRILALHLEHQALTASLFSVTRLNSHSTTREKTLKTMKVLLEKNFDYREGQQPPSEPFTPTKRRALVSLLTGSWEGEQDHVEMSNIQKSLVKLLEFFNGNLLDSGKWSHYCPAGCHENKQKALCDVPWVIIAVKFLDGPLINSMPLACVADRTIGPFLFAICF